MSQVPKNPPKEPIVELQSARGFRRGNHAKETKEVGSLSIAGPGVIWLWRSFACALSVCFKLWLSSS